MRILFCRRRTLDDDEGELLRLVRLKMNNEIILLKTIGVLNGHGEEVRVLRAAGGGYGRSRDTAIIVSEIDWFVGPTSHSALL